MLKSTWWRQRTSVRTRKDVVAADDKHSRLDRHGGGEGRVIALG